MTTTSRTDETTADGDSTRALALRLGFVAGQVVQEVGYDDDCDDELRASIEAVTESALVDLEYDDVVDVVLLWWRDEDGDLVASDISDAAPTAGLQSTSTISASREWQGTRLVAPKAGRR